VTYLLFILCLLACYRWYLADQEADHWRAQAIRLSEVAAEQQREIAGQQEDKAELYCQGLDLAGELWGRRRVFSSLANPRRN
jgi:hypothetical protein